MEFWSECRTEVGRQPAPRDTLGSERAEAATGPEVEGWQRGRVHRIAPLTSLPFNSSADPQRPGSARADYFLEDPWAGPSHVQ